MLFFIVLVVILLSACSLTDKNSARNEDVSEYPTRPIDIIIPYASGGSADVQARIIGNYIQDQLGKAVNVVAKGGGAGSAGMNDIKSSKSNGYKIILTAVGPSTLTPNHNAVGYDVTKDFEQIAQITEAPYGLAVNSKSNINTLDELFQLSKTKHLTYGTTGAGLHQHVVTSALLTDLDDVHIDHLPSDGGAEAISTLLGNHTDASVNTISELIPHVKDGSINILAVTSAERLKELPEVPTFEELGYDLIGNGAWFGFMAPKDTPQEIIDVLDKTIKEGLEDDSVIKQFENAGLPISYLNSKDFTKKVSEENEKNAAIVELLFK